MNDLKALERLEPITNEMLAGLHAGENMKHSVVLAAQNGAKTRRTRSRGFSLVPALCCGLLAVAVIGTAGLRLAGNTQDDPVTVQIGAIAAGNDLSPGVRTVADMGQNASVRTAVPEYESLFASTGADIPLVSVNGAVYRMLITPEDIADSLLGEEVGQVGAHVAEPSLASQQQMEAGLSNVAAQGEAIYGVAGISGSTAVAAQVDGKTRIFQRVSYAGKGPGGQSLEDTFSVRGQVASVTLSGVGTLTGDAANEVIAVLLDQATLKSADATARRQALTVTLNNGLRLQLGVSGDTLCGCGGWSCPEFFEAFEAAL